MGEVKIEVQLGNAVDRELFRRDYIQESQIHQASVGVLLDSGAVMLVLP